MIFSSASSAAFPALAAAIILTSFSRVAAQLPPADPGVSVLPAIGFEPREGAVVLKGSVSLSRVAQAPVIISWVAEDGTALAGADYTAAGGEVSIPAGSLTAPLEVTLLPDARVETAETFSVRITAVSGAAVASEKAVWTIRDTDRPAVAYMSDTVFSKTVRVFPPQWICIPPVFPSAWNAGATPRS